MFRITQISIRQEKDLFERLIDSWHWMIEGINLETKECIQYSSFGKPRTTFKSAQQATINLADFLSHLETE